jgi:glyoxylase-like metal-dependent hydrolase (beta-lactamase superfamily II)
MKPNIEAFFEPVTATLSYVVYDEPGGHAAVVDAVLDFDPKSGRTSTESADRLLDFIAARGLTLDWILETHAHADHLSAARHVKRRAGGRIAIGERIRQVQGAFKKIFNLEPEFRLDGSQFDHLFAEDETFRIGKLEGRVLFVPGHTPADAAYQVGDAVFVGDTMFMPDVGTARCDFPGGSAHTLYRSARRLLALPEETRLLVCHDYPPAGRGPRWETTVREERAQNIHVRDGVTEDQFVAMRTARDATLDMPVLLLPSVQVNVRAGEMPPAEANGVSYLKIPVNAL